MAGDQQVSQPKCSPDATLELMRGSKSRAAGQRLLCWWLLRGVAGELLPGPVEHLGRGDPLPAALRAGPVSQEGLAEAHSRLGP